MTHGSQQPSAFHASNAESTGQYMLTLCELTAPVRLRPPDSESMRQFRFFMSRTAGPNGAAKLQLHMGYFDSLPEAQKWAQRMRVQFPSASAERVPQAEVPVLTDTQVLRVLEARRVTPAPATPENDVRGISLVGPADTQSRRVLKTAVIQGAPVLFAVQMLESAANIDLASIPSLSIFRAYTLYRTTVTREGRALHSLRLGFFKDAISAKQVAYYVRSHFASVAVVPVTEPERQHGSGNPIDPTTLSDSFQRSIDESLQTARPAAPSSITTPAAPSPKRPAQSLEQTLEMLAASEMWDDPEKHSETGVRHLKLEVQKKKSQR
jgi:hypothetical protein